MSGEQIYPTQNLEVLRKDLEQLRDEARVDGALKTRGGARRVRQPEPRGASDDKGKKIARRLLQALRGDPNDDSPVVDGTDFTENGVRALLNLLAAPRKKSAAAGGALQRIQRFLSGPTPKGVQKVADVSADKIRQLARLLERVERNGWEQVRLAQVEKRTANASRAQPATPVPVRKKPRQRRAGS